MPVSHSLDESVPDGYTHDVGSLRVFALTFIIVIEPDRAEVYAASARGFLQDLASPAFRRELQRCGLRPDVVLPRLRIEAESLAEHDLEVDRAMELTRRRPRARPCMFGVTPAGELIESWTAIKPTWAELSRKIEQRVPEHTACSWAEGRNPS